MTKTFSIPAFVHQDEADKRLITLTEANGSTVTHQLPNEDCATMMLAVLLHNLAPKGAS